MKADDFYIGYAPRAPRALGRFVRRVVVALLLAGPVLAALLALTQERFEPGAFEFGVVRDFEGVVTTRPVPMLIATRPEPTAPDLPVTSEFLLVARGKFGAPDPIAELDGRRVTARGSLIYRGGDAMIELEPDSLRALPTPAGAVEAREIDLGRHTLEGEIVDSKCYLGVMKPGRKKTHRACAVRCISGGIPPILRVETAGGDPVHLLLVGANGEAVNKQILSFVAEQVAITGRVQRVGTRLVLYSDAVTIRRLSG